MAPQYQGLHGLSSQILQLGGQGPRIVHFRHVWGNGLLLVFATDSRLKNDSEGASFAPRFPRLSGPWEEAIPRPDEIKVGHRNF